MKVEVISIGDELLIGQTVNTNASWMGTELSLIGAEVEYGSVIKDGEQVILDTFETAMNRVDVVLVTGGLGPTKDDITKKMLCKFFDSELIQNDEVLQHVESFFKQRNRVMLDVNILQAAVPDKATVLHNQHGTAPGMWFERDGKILVSMPGVPYEMKSIMTNEVIPRLKKIFDIKGLYYETIQTQGIGESYIADRIEDMETEMRNSGVYLAYLPSPGGVRLRLSSADNAEMKARIKAYVKAIVELLPQYVFGMGDVNLPEVVGKLLLAQKLKVGTVESCTGGSIAAAITSVSGSSAYFEGSIVSYSPEIKMDLVGVKKNTIDDFGIVSTQVAEQMAIGGKEKLKTDFCIGITGNASISSDLEEDEVGVICIAIAGNERVLSKQFRMEKDRSRNIRRSVLTSLNLLRCELMKINIEKS